MKKESLFTIYDKICTIFYIFIIAIGVNLCFDHGRSAGIFDLLAVFVSVTAVFVLKLLKRKNTDAGESVGAVAFTGLMSALSAVLLIVEIFA